MIMIQQNPYKTGFAKVLVSFQYILFGLKECNSYLT